MPTKYCTIVCVVIALGVAVPAQAQPDPPSRAQEDAPSRPQEDLDGVTAFQKGAEAFKKGDFDTAIPLFKYAHELTGDPTLLYNIARSYEGLDEPAEALAHYEAYLQAAPEAADAGAVQARVRGLQAQIDRRRALAARATPTPPPQPSTPAPTLPPPLSPLPWIVAGAGVLGLAAGGILAGLAQSTKGKAIDEPVAITASDLADDAQGLATAASVTFIVSGVITGAGLLWGVLDLTANGSARLEARGPSLRLNVRF